MTSLIRKAVQRHKLLQYARAHAHERMSPADMANHLDLNRDYFSRVFKKTFGQPARTWLVAQRIKTAAIQLIDTRLTVSQIAFALGYRDVYLFSRQFKHVMGMSPKAYRRRYGAGDGG